MENILQPLYTIKDQFSFTPVIVNEENLAKKNSVVICGMGGSAISVSLLKLFFPELSIRLHNSYGLPLDIDKKNTLVIVNSYSGDTEEALDAFLSGFTSCTSLAVLTRGGKLLEEAKKASVPHVILPSINIEPRFSIGHQMIGLLALMGEFSKINTLKEEAALVNMDHAEKSGKELSEILQNKNIVFYSSSNLFPVTYLIKAAINEGPKIPCFASVVPESNHNEIQSFSGEEADTFRTDFAFIMLSSSYDHVRIIKRLSTMTSLYEEKGFTCVEATIDHTSIQEVFEAVITGYFLATYLALAKKINPYTTPLIQEFKKKILE